MTLITAMLPREQQQCTEPLRASKGLLQKRLSAGSHKSTPLHTPLNGLLYQAMPHYVQKDATLAAFIILA